MHQHVPRGVFPAIQSAVCVVYSEQRISWERGLSRVTALSCALLKIATRYLKSSAKQTHKVTLNLTSNNMASENKPLEDPRTVT